MSGVGLVVCVAAAVVGGVLVAAAVACWDSRGSHGGVLDLTYLSRGDQ